MLEDDRQAVVQACREMNALGINQGTSGNISVRRGDVVLISPSAVPYDQMTPDQVVALSLDGALLGGDQKPSTEWPLHLGLYRARPEFGAVVHGHPTYGTALAMLRQGIPACHYMVAAFGGDDVRCAGYATYGTRDLADLAIQAMQDRSACLLANHGVVVGAASLRRAMWLAVELETLARQYHQARLLGEPVLLDARQIHDTAAKLAGYGVSDDA